VINGEATEADHQEPQKRALTCDRIRVRKEWRGLTRDEQKAYLIAEKCLMAQPNFGLTNNKATYYDTFTHIHQQDWQRYHANAKFPPWHRWFVWIHGYSMEKLCNYTGPVPYWDFVGDASNILASPIFSKDPEVGFGDGGTVPINEIGGSASGYRVDNGAFANHRPFFPIPHYLVRNYSRNTQLDPRNQYGVALGTFYNRAAADRLLGASNYWDFEQIVDGLNGAPNSLSIHNAPHFANSGDLLGPGFMTGTPYFPSQSSAPNDPLFWVQHANVDYLWWKWQNKGKTQQYDFRGGGFFGNDNICDKLPFSGLGPDIPVAAALKTEWYPLCYTYAT